MRLAKCLSTLSLFLLLALAGDDMRSVFVPQTLAGRPVNIQCVCGDGLIEPPPPGTVIKISNTVCESGNCPCTVANADEQCDDGNTTDGDGCSASCRYEPGWNCTQGTPTKGGVFATDGYVESFCAKCGNGKVEKGEYCDLGTDNGAGKGCDNYCFIEFGWTCANGKCQKCGNGVLETGEKCDDGNSASSDGCAADCKIESGYTCTGTPSKCKKCGNGIVETGEKCDDGNSVSSDGCSKYCTIESGWTCTAEKGAGSECGKLCGNGLREMGESCDLGGSNGKSKGCTSLCKVEAKWKCTGNPSVCTSTKTGEKSYPTAASSSSRSSSRQSSVSSRSSSSSSEGPCQDRGFGMQTTTPPTCPPGTVLRTISSPYVPGVKCYDCPMKGFNY